MLGWNIGLMLMARERLERSLHRAARQDPLTQVLNRAGFREIGERLLQRHRRDRRSLAVMLMDLDHFKQVNDRYGHAAGDQLLCAFTESARQALRSTDVLGRHGGEEFCAVLPDTDLAEALAVAERVRAAFEQVRIEALAGPLGTTVSIGVALIDAAGADSLDPALGLADDALYRAKRLGRNRVCHADALGAGPDSEAAVAAPVAPSAA